MFVNLQGWQIQSEEIDNELKSYSEHIRKAINYFKQLDVTTEQANINNFEALIKQVNVSINPNPNSEYFFLFYGEARQELENIYSEVKRDLRLSRNISKGVLAIQILW